MLCHIDRREISFNILKLLRFLTAYNPAYAGLEMTTLWSHYWNTV